jgi:leucine dehydrogenase
MGAFFMCGTNKYTCKIYLGEFLMLQIKELSIPGYYRVARGINKETGLDAIIAVHSITLGKALGGCRIMHYNSYEEQLQDALNLSKGMTYKSSAAGLDLGGGKTTINWSGPLTEEIASSFGEFINKFNEEENIYMTAGDIGTGLAECEMISKYTSHIQGSQGDLDSGWATAYGVFMAMQGAIKYKGLRWKKIHVAVNGLGKVGARLARFLVGAGCRVTVADINEAAAIALCDELGCDMASYIDIHRINCDVYAPCAIGGAINADTVKELNCSIVCGGANNQLATPDMIDILESKNIFYVPDYIANAGGVIIVTAIGSELVDLEYSNPKVISKLNAICEIVELITANHRMGTNSVKSANQIAENRL